MSKIITPGFKILSIVVMTMVTLISCEFKKIDDAMFPEEKLYMAAAVNGIYWINSVPSPANLPTPGNPSRFSTNSNEGRLIVPLGVYRGGVSNSGSIQVTMSAKTDTVQNLLAAGQLPGATLLPADKYNIGSVLVIPDGQTTGFAELNVDLNFLKNNPSQIYAIAIEATSSQRMINPLLNTVVVVIDTRLLVPSANFSYKVDATDWKKITFSNTSANIVSSEWDFGDGTISTENEPVHTFPSEGAYVVKLTAKGVAGDISVKTTNPRIFDVNNIIDVAKGKPVKISDGTNGQNAVDGLITASSRWLSTATDVHWIEIDLQKIHEVVSFKTWIGANGNFDYPVAKFYFQAEVDGQWVNIAEVEGNTNSQYETMFPAVKTSKVRYYVPAYTGNQVRMYEISVYAIP